MSVSFSAWRLTAKNLGETITFTAPEFGGRRETEYVDVELVEVDHTPERTILRVTRGPWRASAFLDHDTTITITEETP